MKAPMKPVSSEAPMLAAWLGTPLCLWCRAEPVRLVLGVVPARCYRCGARHVNDGESPFVDPRGTPEHLSPVLLRRDDRGSCLRWSRRRWHDLNARAGERSTDRPFRAEHEETLEAAHWIECATGGLVEVEPALYPFVRCVELGSPRLTRRGEMHVDRIGLHAAPHEVAEHMRRPNVESYIMRGALEARGWRTYEIGPAGELIEHEAYPAARARERARESHRLNLEAGLLSGEPREYSIRTERLPTRVPPPRRRGES